MLITRTPFRVSFAGGGTDLPSFYRSNGNGSVVSTTIKQYMYIVIHPYFQDKIRIKYSQTEDVSSIDDIQHPIVRECLKRVDIEKGIEITSFSDVPAGTGLGSSSAFTVGLLHALYIYRNVPTSKAQLAKEACEIEIDILGEPIGKQDQYAAAFGGLNYFRFNDDESVEVRPIELSEDQKRFLETTLSLHFVGGSRQASNILGRVKQALDQGDEFASLILIRQQADELLGFFKNHEKPNIGSTLSEGWRLKKRLTYGVSNTQIERILSIAEEKGMMGGKLLGAGGNGFLLLQHEDSKSLISTLGSRHIPFQFDNSGTEVLFNDHQ